MAGSDSLIIKIVDVHNGFVLLMHAAHAYTLKLLTTDMTKTYL